MKARVALLLVLACTVPSLLTCTDSAGPVSDGSSEVGNPVTAGLYGYLIDERYRTPAESALVRVYALSASPKALLLRKPLGANDLPLDSVLTDSNGLYVFDTLDSGTYAVEGLLYDGPDTLYAYRGSIAHDSLTYAGTDTLRPPGAIRGTIVVDQGGDKAGVTCYVPGTSYLAITDSLGQFIITNVPPGNYSLTYMHGVYRDTTIAGIVVKSDSVTLVPAMVLYFDPNQNERDIWGTFDAGYEGIGRVVARITGDGIPDSTPRTFTLGWNAGLRGYSGFIYTPSSGFFWKVTVIVYDTLGRKTGQCDVLFDRNTGDIHVPVFDPLNAVPHVDAGQDTVVSINDTIRLHGTAADTFGGSIVRWEWNVEGRPGFGQSSVGDTVVMAPSASDSDYACVLRVTDDDGNEAADTCHVEVVLDPPILSITATPSWVVRLGDTVTLRGGATQAFGQFVTWEWDIGGTGVFVASDAGSPVSFVFGHDTDSVTSVLRVVDDDGNVALDSATVVGMGAATADTADSILEAYWLTPAEEAQFSGTDTAISPFFGLWERQVLDRIVLSPSENSYPGRPPFAGPTDAGVVVRAAYGDSGVYLLLAVRDDAWQTDSGLGDSADCVVVFADALPSTTIASCTDCSIGLGHKSLSYTTNYLRIETGAGNSVKFSQYDDNMWSWIEHTLPKSDLGRLWGITCEEIASPSGERSVELLIRWGTFRRIGGPWPPSSGTLLGLSVGYDDRDAPSATKSLRWLGKDPWADDADSVQYWGDLRIGMRP